MTEYIKVCNQELYMIFDHHDDLGTFLRQKAPSLAETSLVKEASWVEKPDLLDRQFALILIDESGNEHRKLAMHDAGNTLSSIYYFLQTEHSLPDGAIKLAAANLLNSAMHQGLYEAVGDSFLYHEKLGSAFDVLAYLADLETTAGIVDERRFSIKEANSVIGYASSSAPTVNVTGTSGGPMSGMAGATSKPMSTPTVSKPVGSLTANNKPSPMATVAKHASYDIIKQAEWYWTELSPVERRQIAIDLAPIAEAEGTRVPEKIAQYGGNELNPVFDFIMKRRQDYTADETLQEDYDRLSKVAHIMPLDDITEALYLLDEQANLLHRYGNSLPDPVLSVYGTKQASLEYSWNHGGDSVNELQLVNFAASPSAHNRMEGLFHKEISDKFKKEPLSTFKSMPLEQQIIVARMAGQSGDHQDGGF